MLRFSEIGLFLVPFALFVTWRILGPRTPKLLVWSALAAVLVLAAGTVWYGLDTRLAPTAQYEPARIENGRVIPGHAAP